MPARAPVRDDLPVISLRELNRATLARQLLLRRARLGVVEALERLTPLQAQWSPSPYLALWSRLAGFKIAHLVDALERRDVVKATLMRGTLHLVTRREYPMYVVLIVRAREAMYRSYLARAGVDIARIRTSLLAFASERPRTRRELVDRVERITRVDWSKHKYGAWPVMYAVDGLVHPAQSARWGAFRSAGLIAADSWLGRHELPPDREAYAGTVRRYLGAFGPAAVADIAHWGVRQTGPLRQALADLAGELVLLRDEKGRVLYDLRRAPRPRGDPDAPVRFLPKWDQLLLAYARPERARVLPERHLRRVIAVNGDVSPTVLVDGVVAARWDARLVKGTAVVTVDPLGRLSRPDRAAIGDEGERLARFIHPEARSRAVRFGDVASYHLAIRP